MKIDLTKIEGYDTMSAEDKVKALEGYEYDMPESNNAEAEKLKGMLSKKNSELSELTKRLREKQTAEEIAEEERKKAEEERVAKEKEKDDLIATLQGEKKKSEYKSKYLALGFDEEMATATAEAKLNGDDDKVFANISAFTQKIKQDAVVNAMNNVGIHSGEIPDAQKESDNALRRVMGLPSR